MTLSELGNGLARTNIPVGYRFFQGEQQLPYILYFSTGTDNFAADNKVYQVIESIEVEYYSQFKDPANEAIIEGFFDDHDLYWDKVETYIDSEQCYQVAYSIRRI